MSLQTLISPTTKGIRGADDYGEGHYGAPRGTRKHIGVDFVGEPYQIVVAPCDLTVVRKSRPYGDGSGQDMGLLFRTRDTEHQVWLFYVEAFYRVIVERKDVHRGQPVGTLISLGTKYPGITDHVHMQIKNMSTGEFVDPTPLLGDSLVSWDG